MLQLAALAETEGNHTLDWQKEIMIYILPYWIIKKHISTAQFAKSGGRWELPNRSWVETALIAILPHTIKNGPATLITG
jgi:hypothetical protein